MKDKHMNATKLHSTFTLTFDMLRFLAGHAEGLTIGQVQSSFFGCSYGQVKRMLTTLEDDGFVSKQNVPHGKTGKNLYRLTENAAIWACDIAQTYSTNYNGGM